MSDLNQGATEQAAPVVGHPGSELANVDALLFKAANICRSYEETRYYLNGVYIQPHPEKGVLLVATDGHRLLVVHDESGSCGKPIIVTVEDRALTAVKPPKKKNPNEPHSRLTVYQDGRAAVETYRSKESSIIDGTYPDYARVFVPILKNAQTGQFMPSSVNCDYLTAFAHIAAIVNGDSKAIKIISNSEADPSLVLFDRAPHVVGVLMPMRSTIGNGVPTFLKPLLDPLMAPPAPVVPQEPDLPIKSTKPAKSKARRKTKKAAAKRPVKKAKKAKRRAA